VLLVNVLAGLNFANVFKNKKRLENLKNVKKRKNVTNIKNVRKRFYIYGRKGGLLLRRGRRGGRKVEVWGGSAPKPKSQTSPIVI